MLINPFQTNGIFHKATYNKVRMVHHYRYCGVTGYNFHNILSLKVEIVSKNSAHPDEMPHIAAFHLGLHCLQK